MTNFRIEFTYPLLLLVLIVAIGFALYTFFSSGKRYRKNRNRIVSLVLHIVITVLCVSVLAGISISYDKPNNENEVMLVVDVSDSGYEATTRRNNFVKSIIDESEGKFKVGIVTFGYDQVYAVPLTNNTSSIYNKFLNAELPDTSASDLNSALVYARERISYPQTAKLVVISDGMQTDNNALGVIKSIVLEGIKVDTAYYPSVFTNDLQIVNVTTPDYNVTVGETFKLGVDVQSSFVGSATITLTDVNVNGVSTTEQFTMDIVDDVQTLELNYRFSLPGLHQLTLTIESNNDTIESNNVYCTYMDLQVFDQILMVETYEGEGNQLNDMLLLENFEVTRVNVADPKFPQTLGELRKYDQIIMVNVASVDLPAGFDKILTRYVEEFGGGLLTVGGNRRDDKGDVVLDGYQNPIPNAYNSADNYNSNNPYADEHPNPTYQDLLPVKAETYSPPIGVMIIIDRSGSMMADFGGESKLEWAKIGAKACIDILNPRDYVGVMTLEDYYNEDAQLTPVTHQASIKKAIDAIEGGGGTVFTGALQKAGAALLALSNVEKRHIILISDGAPYDAENYMSPSGFGPEIIRLKEMGITLSAVMVGGVNASAENLMRNCSEVLGGGRYYNVTDYKEFTSTMIDELTVKEIKAYNAEPFVPAISTQNSLLNNVDIKKIPQLGGFYGSSTKQGATEVLSAEFVPVYSTWKVGKGHVGSFMSDLNGTWSNEWFNDITGKQLILNIINGNMPTEDVAGHEITVQIKQENYKNQMSITAPLALGESIDVKITNLSDKTTQTFSPKADGGFARVYYDLTKTGVYKIEVQKYNALGVKVGTPKVVYQTFSYSKEYDTFADASQGIELLSKLANLGGGKMVNEAEEVFENANMYLHIVYNPKPAFVIISLVLFLLDIAVRKFKFKWPHEIVRDRKIKKQLKQK